MNKQGPIVIIDDDVDDRHLISLVFEELDFGNEIVLLHEADDALAYLGQEEVCPFLILCDINMPKLNGFELRAVIQQNAELRRKCIPFLFFTTASGGKAVYEAYALSAQGFFVKPTEYEKLKEMLHKIVDYWQQCHSPANYNCE